MNETTSITKEIIATALSGSEYPFDVPKAIAAQAKAAGLLIVYGASDDLIEFDGAFRDEQGCYGGDTIKIDAQGALPDFDSLEDEEDHADYAARKPNARDIHALWDPGDGYSWRYETDIPHVTFEITEDGEPYCRGMVIDLADLQPGAEVQP